MILACKNENGRWHIQFIQMLNLTVMWYFTGQGPKFLQERSAITVHFNGFHQSEKQKDIPFFK